MAHKTLCIHGHFYQPPREDPLTGAIPVEPGASPYRNWNERIHAECYRPNVELGNLEWMSFNFGPTLLSWMASYDPATYRRIIAQDQANSARWGAGNAIAQAYHHTILPLASAEEKAIQVYWGMADFQHRFGRKPQGMWLPETAVDYETLMTLANHGLRFTILAPWQAEDGDANPLEPALVELADGRSITVFFFERELSARLSFDPEMTSDPERFVSSELPRYFREKPAAEAGDALLLLASDGEVYGHHQPKRERFLAGLLDGAGARAGVVLTYPALWLQDHPPRRKVRIRERTSWSCHHGVVRWMGDCDCTLLDGHWKAYLRRAFDRLAAALDSLYLEAVYPHVSKPRVLRRRYIHALLGQVSPQALIREMAGKELSGEQVLRIHLLLESQRERQRMFTSCGWFFEHFDRIEARNNLAFAAHAVRLARLATGDDLSNEALEDLRQVSSPLTGLRADVLFRQLLEKTWTLQLPGWSEALSR